MMVNNKDTVKRLINRLKEIPFTHNAVIVFKNNYDEIVVRDILSHSLIEVKSVVANWLNTYRDLDFPYALYIDGEIEESSKVSELW